jgi:threonine synthase
MPHHSSQLFARRHGNSKRGQHDPREGLSVPQDIDATLALGLLRECKGTGIVVTDEEVFAAQEELLRREGIYCEPAGAAGFAGYLQARRNHSIDRGQTSICLVTGSGFKDPASIERTAAGNPTLSIEPAEIRQTVQDLYEGDPP